jgi:hypothetical protein
VAKRTDRQSPDYLLAEEGFTSLNDTLYTAAPQDYFERRLMNLALVASKRTQLDAMLRQGLEFGDLKLGPTPPEADAPDEAKAAKTAAHFVTAEAEVLGHHVGETLLRLYLAHAWVKGKSPPGCPWLQLSRLRSPWEFKQQVTRRFVDAPADDPDNLAAVAGVFYLTDQLTAFGADLDPVRWNKSLATIESYLRAFASEFLERAPLYNAAKHGFAVMATEMGLRFGTAERPIFDQPTGPVIRYLEAKESDDRSYWWEVTHWVKSDLRMTVTYLGCQLIELLWNAARYRYVEGSRGSGFQLSLFERPTYGELVANGREGSGIDISNMSMQLHYYEEPPEISRG